MSLEELHLNLRNLTPEDYPQLKRLMDAVYDDIGGAWSKLTIDKLIGEFADGQIIVEDDGKIVGVALTVLVDYDHFSNPHKYDELIGHREIILNDANGDALYGLDVLIDPAYRLLRGLGPEARLAARRELSAPIIAAFRPWLEAQLSRIPRSSKLAEDIRYTLARWPGLTRFLNDGRLELDTNPVENQIRKIALTRKNALFAGHEVGAENWALLASRIANCNTSQPRLRLASLLRKVASALLWKSLQSIPPDCSQKSGTQCNPAMCDCRTPAFQPLANEPRIFSTSPIATTSQ